MRRVLVRFLRERDFSVEAATNGRQVVAGLRRVTPAVILTEETLPLLSEWRAMSEAATHLSSKHIPIILMLSEGIPDALEWPVEPSAVLVKPFRLDTMLGELRRALRTRS